MSKSKAIISIGLTLGMSALAVSFSATPALAADTALVEQTLVTETLTDLGIAPSDQLLAEIVDTLDESVLDDGLTDLVGDAIDAGEEPGEGLDEGLDENETEQDEIWTDFGDTWRAAFAVVKADFDACRAADSDGGVKECASAFTSALRVAHAEALITWAEEQLTLVDTLPEEERAAAIEELNAAIARAQEKLLKIAEKDAKVAERALTKLDKAQERAEERRSGKSPDSSPSPEDGSTDIVEEISEVGDESNGNGNGNGNKKDGNGNGNNGNGNGNKKDGNGNGNNGNGNGNKKDGK
ncbi:hypothetical protein GM51_22170 [freshwater metagenome]|uniref:DUF5667 domain-containing protein n=1 Tax=freshwater metagenome TaxID=449393 RepID=A0A094PJM5_9ZZZZ